MVTQDDSVLENASMLLMLCRERNTRRSRFLSVANDKGKAAADALKAAATIPLPLKRCKSDQTEIYSISKKRALSQHDKVIKRNFKATWPVPDYYLVDPNEIIITCVCGINEDDNFLVQCSHCHRWQHGECYRLLKNYDLSKGFLCNICNPRLKSIDIELARAIQNEKVTQMKKIVEKDTDKSIQDLHSSIANYKVLKSCTFKNPVVENFIKRHIKDEAVEVIDTKTDENLNGDLLELKPYSGRRNSVHALSPSNLGLFAKTKIAKGSHVHEIVGEIDFQDTYMNDPKNHYRIWAAPKPKVFYHPKWPVLIDARSSGNITRFTRFSCKPNVEVVSVKKNSTDKNYSSELKFYLKATKDIEKGEEVQFAWHWDLRHPMWHLINKTRDLESLSETDKYWLMHSVGAVLQNCKCACGHENQNCNLYEVKRHSETFYKSAKSKQNNKSILMRLQRSPMSRANSDCSPTSMPLAQDSSKTHAYKWTNNQPISDTIAPTSNPSNIDLSKNSKFPSEPSSLPLQDKSGSHNQVA